MLSSAEEAEVLRLALQHGLLHAEQLASSADALAATLVPQVSAPASPWGVRLTELILRGVLAEEAVRDLVRQVRLAAMDQTARASAAQLLATGPQVSINPLHDSFPVPNWDRYEFVSLLGRGGMGTVYKARDRQLGRTVALKFLLGTDERTVKRFYQEARAQARIDHPNVCKVHDVGEVDGKFYIAMQCVDGVSLQQANATLTLTDKIQLIQDAADALHAAHQLGIVHRDVKPSNIMVERTADGGWRPVIMDFGLARESDEGAGLTESGAVMGTPGFMSPEQARGEARRLDRRTDVYGLGATLYWLLAGAPPFDAETVALTVLRVITEEPKLLRSVNPTVPAALETIVSKCLNKEPAQRYLDAQALADDLRRYLDQKKIVGKRVGLWYRLKWRARNNRPVVVLLCALAVSLLSLAAYGVRARVLTLRHQEQARLQTALAQKLGQSVERFEWLVRTSYMLPLHNVEPDLARLRTQMTELEHELPSLGDAGVGLGHYALGRELLALQWTEAILRLASKPERSQNPTEVTGVFATSAPTMDRTDHKSAAGSADSSSDGSTPRPSVASALDGSALERLRRIAGGDPAVMHELASIFLEDLLSFQVEAPEFLRKSDWVSLHRAAHTIKASSRDFGAGPLAEIAKEIEQLTHAGHYETAQTRLPSLLTETEAVTGLLRQLLGELQPAATQ